MERRPRSRRQKKGALRKKRVTSKVRASPTAASKGVSNSDHDQKVRESPPTKMTSVDASGDSIARFKAGAKRRTALLQQVLRNLAVVRQEAPLVEEWRKKMEELSSHKKIAHDFAQKFQKNAAEFVLLKSSHQAELNDLRRRLAVLSADLAASQDARVASDTKIAQLAKQLTNSKIQESDCKKEAGDLKAELASLREKLNREASEHGDTRDILKTKREEIESLRVELESQKKACSDLEAVTRSAEKNLASQAAKGSQEKAELSRHLLNISTETKALKVQVTALKGDLAESREQAKSQRESAMTAEKKLRDEIASAKTAYERSLTVMREKCELQSQEIDKLRADAKEQEREAKSRIGENETALAMLRDQLKTASTACASEKRQRREIETKLKADSEAFKSTISGLKAELANTEDSYFGETEGLKKSLESAKKKMVVQESQVLQLSSALKQSKKSSKVLEKRVAALTESAKQSELLLEEKGAELVQLRQEMDDRIVATSTRENEALERQEKAKRAIASLAKRLASASAELAAERDARTKAETKQSAATKSARELSDKLHLVKKELSTAQQDVQVKVRALEAQMRSAAEARHASDAALAEAKRSAARDVKRLEDSIAAQKTLIATTEREKSDLLEQIERSAKRSEEDLRSRRKLEQQLNASRAALKKQEEALETQRRSADEASRLQKQQAAMLDIERREQRRETQKLRRALDEVRVAFKQSQKKAADHVSTFTERLEAAKKEKDNEKQRRLELRKELKSKEELIASAAIEVEKWRKKHRTVEQSAAAEEARLRQQVKDVEIAKMSAQRQVHDLTTKLSETEKGMAQSSATLEAARQRMTLLERQLATATAMTASLEEKMELGETARLERDQLAKELAALRLVVQQERANRETADQITRTAAEKNQLEIERLQKELRRREALHQSMVEKEIASEKRYQDFVGSSKVKIEELKSRIITEQERFDLRIAQLQKESDERERQLKDERLMRRSERAESSEISAKLRAELDDVRQKRAKLESDFSQERMEHDSTRQRVRDLEKSIEVSKEAKRSSDKRASDAERAGMKVAKQYAEQRKERAELERVWKAVEQKLVSRVASLQSELKGCRAKVAWQENQSKVFETESRRLAEQTQMKLKQAMSQMNALREQLQKSKEAQSQLKLSASEAIESLRRDLSEQTSRSQRDLVTMQREKHALLAAQNHLRTKLEQMQSEKQRALALAAQRATAIKKAERAATDARNLAARQQEQNRRALDAFDRAQGTTKEKDARVALWKQQLQSTEERTSELEKLLRELRAEHLSVSEDLKSARSTIEQLRKAAKQRSIFDYDSGDGDSDERRPSNAAMDHGESGRRVSSASTDGPDALLRRWNRLLEDADAVVENGSMSGKGSRANEPPSSSIKTVDDYLDGKKAAAAHAFAREAFARDALNDDDVSGVRDNGEESARRRQRPRSSSGRKSRTDRPSSSRRRFSGSSVQSKSRESARNRPGSVDRKANRPCSRDSRLPMVGRQHMRAQPQRRSFKRRSSAESIDSSGRAFDDLISTPPVGSGGGVRTAEDAFDALISTPKEGETRAGASQNREHASIRKTGGGGSKKSGGTVEKRTAAFQSLDELEYVS